MGCSWSECCNAPGECPVEYGNDCPSDVVQEIHKYAREALKISMQELRQHEKESTIRLIKNNPCDRFVPVEKPWPMELHGYSTVMNPVDLRGKTTDLRMNELWIVAPAPLDVSIDIQKNLGRSDEIILFRALHAGKGRWLVRYAGLKYKPDSSVPKISRLLHGDLSSPDRFLKMHDDELSTEQMCDAAQHIVYAYHLWCKHHAIDSFSFISASGSTRSR